MKYTIMIFLVLLFGCGTSLIIDPSPQAYASGDLTLALKSCFGPLGSGFGVCRVKEGTQVTSSWQAVLPKLGGAVLGGELVVRVRDVTKTYALPDDGIVDVPLSDFFGPVWKKDDTGIFNATAKLRVRNDQGLEVIVMAEGQFLVRVLAVGYDPLPIDSGFVAWGTHCRVTYSTAGRGAVSCD